MGPNFSPVIAFSGDQVLAMGPLGVDDLSAPDTVEEIRAWVYQGTSVSFPVPGASSQALLWSANDAAAADSGDPSALRQGPGVCWMLPLTTITQASFKPLRAFAVAMALISNGAPAGKRDRGSKVGRVVWWGHPIRLIGTADAYNKANGVLQDLEAGVYVEANNTSYFVELERELRALAGDAV